MVCANAPYRHKLLLMLTEKYNMSACFVNQTYPLKYVAQKCAWMDIPTCWNWINEVFYPDVRRRSCHPVLLLMDPGYLEPFQKKECCGALFYFQYNKLETAMRFGSYCSC